MAVGIAGNFAGVNAEDGTLCGIFHCLYGSGSDAYQSHWRFDGPGKLFYAAGGYCTFRVLSSSDGCFYWLELG